MTATSNIHSNLSAWVGSHAYSLGNRVSHSSAAYQVTVAGTSASSGGPTGTSSSITDGSVTWKWLSAVDYVSVQSWATALSNPLTQPCVGLVWNNGGITTTAGTPYLTLSGKTTSSTNTITLKPAPGESFRDTLIGGGTALLASQANGVAFTFPASTGSVNYFSIETSNTFISGLQFIDTNATSNCTQFAFGAVGNVRVDDCIFDGYGQAGGSAILGYDGAGTGITVANCLILDRTASPGTGCATIECFSNPLVFVNCTIYALNSPTASLGIESQNTAGSVVVKNCIMLGYAAANAIACASTGTAAADHSLFSNASLTGTNVTTGSGNLFSKTASNQFVSTTVDFRIKTTADAKNAGTTDSTDIPTADDIVGTSRPQGASWDIGAMEFPVVATGPVSRIITLE